MLSLVPSPLGEKGSGASETLEMTGGFVPMPLSDTVCGLPAALSLMLSVAVRSPTAPGLKVTVIVQLAPASRVAGQLFVWVKSPAFVPAMLMPLIVSAALPVLVSVTVWAALVVLTG